MRRRNRCPTTRFPAPSHDASASDFATSKRSPARFVPQPALDGARRRIEGSLGKFVTKGTLSGADRDAAIERMSAVLSAMAVEGTESNLAFLRKVLAHPAFVAGEVGTGFVERWKKDLLG